MVVEEDLSGELAVASSLNSGAQGDLKDQTILCTCQLILVREKIRWAHLPDNTRKTLLAVETMDKGFFVMTAAACGWISL